MLKDIFYGTVLVIFLTVILTALAVAFWLAWPIFVLVAVFTLGFFLVDKALVHFLTKEQ